MGLEHEGQMIYVLKGWFSLLWDRAFVVRQGGGGNESKHDAVAKVLVRGDSENGGRKRGKEERVALLEIHIGPVNGL